MKYTKDNILEQYEKSGQIMYNATLNGDYKKNNREGAKLRRIFKEFEKNSDLADECIPELLRSSNVVVKTEAAAYCLALKKNLDLAEHILTNIATNPSYGIFAFYAEMTLNVWREKKSLKMY